MPVIYKFSEENIDRMYLGIDEKMSSKGISDNQFGTDFKRTPILVLENGTTTKKFEFPSSEESNEVAQEKATKAFKEFLSVGRESQNPVLEYILKYGHQGGFRNILGTSLTAWHIKEGESLPTEYCAIGERELKQEYKYKLLENGDIIYSELVKPFSVTRFSEQDATTKETFNQEIFSALITSRIRLVNDVVEHNIESVLIQENDTKLSKQIIPELKKMEKGYTLKSLSIDFYLDDTIILKPWQITLAVILFPITIIAIVVAATYVLAEKLFNFAKRSFSSSDTANPNTTKAQIDESSSASTHSSSAAPSPDTDEPAAGQEGYTPKQDAERASSSMSGRVPSSTTVSKAEAKPRGPTNKP